MRKIKKSIETLSAFLIILLLTGYACYEEGKTNVVEQQEPVPKDTIPVFFSQTAEEGLMEALIYYDIKHPEIVYAQAILETGHFTSAGCLEDNNLFGLYNSKANRYHNFDHWTESVVAYRDWIQGRYKPPANYYVFLQRIGYATDPHYTKKLKIIVEEYDKRRYIEGDSLSQRY
jgi:flagellum-specific peptidoglycan hydrolase FlgJ